MKPFLIATLLLASGGLAAAAPQVSGDGACGTLAVDNESFLTCEGGRAPAPVDDEAGAPDAGATGILPVTSRQAWKLKRDLGRRALLVDIRERAEVFYTGMPLGADANVPFLEPVAGFAVDNRTGEPEMTPNAGFLDRIDTLLESARLGRDDPVVLLCRSGERSRVAADMMRRSGYRQVFVVADGFEGPLAANADGTFTRRELGWKNAGLPWTARLEPGWLHAQRPSVPR
ncbi:MAG: hypothetical protein IPH30_15735 [Betaproteobacteria bacterium]|nr:hypothetical protein [Betaproteobacteria bacterium]